MTRETSAQEIDGGPWDYVIVGAGAAGCVLANRLSADPATRVLLLEAGGKDDWIWFHIPVGYLYCIGNPRADWGFSTVAETGLNGRSLAYPRGRVLGGCTAINGMLYLRGQAADYDHWRQLGCAGWGWDDVLPFFRRSEDFFAGASEMHGAGGEWRVEKQRLSWKILDAVEEAFVAAGVPRSDDFNTGDNLGVGRFRVNQRKGVRWSAARGFLKPAMGRANLRVVTGAQAERVLLEGRRAVGVRWRGPDGPRQARAAGEVVLSAGAIGSPQLLQLSGIGPGALLAGNGIDVVHEAPQVGENLQDHLQIRCVWKVQGATTLNTLSASLLGKARIAAQYALFRSGPMSMAPSQLCAFVPSGPDVATPDLEYHVQPLSLDSFGGGLHAFPAITLSVCNLRPESRGHVRIVSPNAAAHPEIAPNYLSTPGDRRVAAASIRHARRVAAQAPLARHRPEEFRPGTATGDDDDALAKAAGDIGTTIFHPVGTARMGADDAAPLDPSLRVRGIAGLRVVDASAMPTITSGNTASPTIMIAEKAAAMILAG